jgi:putative dehydrogenase
MNDPAIGFIGLGRLGFPIASLLLEAGDAVVCCGRGRSDELVAKGATIAGDGSPRAVAESADVVFTCLPADAVGPVIAGTDGLIAADGRLPIVVELSTAPIREKKTLRDQLVERGGELLDCPVSGTPAMAAAQTAVIYASGDRQTYEEVADLLTAISPRVAYIGELGAGTKMKYVANLLALVHVTAAGEAMAFATTLGLDLNAVAEAISHSPAATSGQFDIRAPMIAAQQFEGKLVTIGDVREVLDQIASAAAEVGASVPLASVAKGLFDEFGDQGDDESDPGKLALFLRHGAATRGPMAPPPHDADTPEQAKLRDEVSGRVNQMLNKRLYVGLSKVNRSSPPPPIDVIHEHLKWAQGLERQGVLFAAGPFVDDEGAILGDGLFVVRADSEAEVADLLADDPIHVGNFRRCTVHGWALHEGTINVSINLSDQTYSLD